MLKGEWRRRGGGLDSASLKHTKLPLVKSNLLNHISLHIYFNWIYVVHVAQHSKGHQLLIVDSPVHHGGGRHAQVRRLLFSTGR